MKDADNGTNITARVGGTVEIEVAGNPTTGYSWETKSVNAAVLKPVGEPEYRQTPRPAGGQPLVGAGGTFIFRFKALAAGTSPVHLIYRRPWEKDAPPAQEFKATVVVR